MKREGEFKIVMTKEEKKEYMRKWYQIHKEYIKKYWQVRKKERKEYMKNWYQEHKKEVKKRSRRRYQVHKGELKEQYREYYQVHKDELKEQHKKWRQMHRREQIKSVKLWQKEHPERMRELRGRAKSKRRRNLGFNPLNEWFEGSEAHHINLETVVYIPKEMHRSVSHNVWTGKNMWVINGLAAEFLLSNEVF